MAVSSSHASYRPNNPTTGEDIAEGIVGTFRSGPWKGLSITKTERGEKELVLVDDGNVRWVADVGELAAAMTALEEEFDAAADEAELDIYAELCNRVDVVDHPENCNI